MTLTRAFTIPSHRLLGLAAAASFFLLAACDDDPRAQRLQNDLDTLSQTEASGIVELSVAMRDCLMSVGKIEELDGSISSLGPVNVLSRQNGNKLLLLFRYPDLKEITKETQPVFFEWAELCAGEFGLAGADFYIAFTGKYITGMIKTPRIEEVGITADETALHAFYDGLPLN